MVLEREERWYGKMVVGRRRRRRRTNERSPLESSPKRRRRRNGARRRERERGRRERGEGASPKGISSLEQKRDRRRRRNKHEESVHEEPDFCSQRYKACDNSFLRKLCARNDVTCSVGVSAALGAFPSFFPPNGGRRRERRFGGEMEGDIPRYECKHGQSHRRRGCASVKKRRAPRNSNNNYSYTQNEIPGRNFRYSKLSHLLDPFSWKE